MNLEDARSAKQELWSTLRFDDLDRFESRLALARGDRARSISGQSFAAALGSEKAPDAPDYALSLGISVKPEGDFGVAVRIQSAKASRTIAGYLSARFGQRDDVDFRIIGSVRSFKPWYRDVARPLCIGPSVGHHAITAGTLGGFVSVHGQSGEYMLSNNHVLANVDRASRGDMVLQPGPSDNLAPQQLIAGRFETAVLLNENTMNAVDCAIARVESGIDIEPSNLWNVGQLVGTTDLEESLSNIVFKVGRTTGLTWGRITAIELDPIEIDMGVGIHAFDNQIEIEGTGRSPFSRPGDSGSLVVDPQLRAIGLLFAGSTAGGSNGRGLTYVNRISEVLSSLNATLVC